MTSSWNAKYNKETRYRIHTFLTSLSNILSLKEPSSYSKARVRDSALFHWLHVMQNGFPNTQTLSESQLLHVHSYTSIPFSHAKYVCLYILQLWTLSKFRARSIVAAFPRGPCSVFFSMWNVFYNVILSSVYQFYLPFHLGKMLQLVIIIIFREMNIFRWTMAFVFSVCTHLYPYKKVAQEVFC